MANEIQKPRETWYVTNLTRQDLHLYDIPNFPVLKYNQRINALDYASTDELYASANLNTYINQGWVKSEDYLHTHDDKTNLTTFDSHIENTKNVHGIKDTDQLVLKTGSINQLNDITSNGEQVEDAVDKAENLEGKVLMVDIFYYLEKLNATQTEKLQGFCEYHKTMLASHLNVNRKTTLVYDEKQDKFIDKKEPIFSAILRSFMGNTQGGRRHNRTIKQKRKMNKTRRNKKSRKPRHTRRRK